MNRIRNMGGADRVLRAVAGLGLVAVGLSAGLAWIWQVAAFVVGAILLLTATIRFCPAYVPFRIDTRWGRGKAA